MKIIVSDKDTYGESVNFVDDYNVFVGYDMSQGCCENFGWFISERREKEIIEHKELDVSGFFFDPVFFEESRIGESCDETNMVRFRLVGEEKELFLHLYNCHNGYYSHGFEFKKGDKVLHSGSL